MFTIHNHQVVISPDILSIPAFNKLYKRDKTKEKTRAYEEFAYIYHICDWGSPYKNTTDLTERKQKVKESYIKDNTWTEDSDIQEAIKAYTELTKTPLMGLLEDAYTMINNLRDYFKSANFSLLDQQGKLVYDPNKAMSNLEKLSKVVESMKALEQAVAKERSESSKVRGNKQIAYDEKS